MKKDMIDDTTEMNEEEIKELTRKYEDDILGGLMAAAAFHTDEEDIATINIVRKVAGQKVTVLSFRIRPLGEEEYLKARKENTVYKRNKQLGTRVADHVDTSKYRSQLIYDATLDEDRKKIWDNREAWNKFAVVNGIDLIDSVLKAGEKDTIIDKLDEISGYQLSTEETAKN